MKSKYTKIIEGNPSKEARIVISKIGENDYEIIEHCVTGNKGIDEALLKDVTDDADNEGVTLNVDMKKILIL